MSKTNPQSSTPFNNSTAHLSIGHVLPVPNMPPLGSQSSFMNFPNQLPHLQSNHPGMLHFGPTVAMHQGQCQLGFGPQNTIQNLNNVSTFQLQRPFFNLASNANQFNPSQPPGQLYMQNAANVPPHLNQNIGVPYGQFQMQTPVQNMNQFNPMQMLVPTQVGPYYVPSSSVPMLGCPNSQAMGPLNHAFIPNSQFGLVHSSEVGQHGNPNLQKAVNPSMDANASLQLPIPTQQSLGNLSASLNHHSVQLRQAKKNLQQMGSQSNHVEGGRNDFSKSHGNKSKRENFNRNSKSEMSHSRYQQSQFHHMKNAKRQLGGFGKNGGGFRNDRSGIYGQANRARVQEKRSISLNYTEQEVQQWREERRKSYPSNANINKKLIEKLTKSEVIDREAKLRRMQLKEILAKQAELGVEVAEIPPHYFSDSENQLHGRIDNRNAPDVKERFQNQRNKRGRYDRRDRFVKKQKWEKSDSSNMPKLNIRKPTLLQKLLSADIKRDKSHLLQVFRFMVMNSFFKESPEKPLKFPLVLLKDSGFEAIDETLVEEFDNEKDGGDSYFDNDGKDAQTENRISEEDEEEGEIID